MILVFVICWFLCLCSGRCRDQVGACGGRAQSAPAQPRACSRHLFMATPREQDIAGRYTINTDVGEATVIGSYCWVADIPGLIKQLYWKKKVENRCEKMRKDDNNHVPNQNGSSKKRISELRSKQAGSTRSVPTLCPPITRGTQRCPAPLRPAGWPSVAPKGSRALQKGMLRADQQQTSSSLVWPWIHGSLGCLETGACGQGC